MVEPLASLVLNSLLSARNSAIGPIRLAYGLPSAPKKYVSSNFFTPAPRRTKGKQKAPNHTCSEQLFECQEWTRCSIRHSDWCPIHCRKLVLDELLADRVRTPRRESSRVPRSLHTRTRTNSHRSVHSLQRKHALHASEPVRSIASQFSSLGGRGSPPDSLNPSASTPTLPADPGEAAERFKQLSQLELEQLNLDDAWNAYLAAVESNALSVISPDDVLELIAKMIRTVERKREKDLDVDAVRGWGKCFSGAIRATLLPIASSSRSRRRHCLLARCAAMLDDCDRALELLHSAQGFPAPSEDYDSAQAYEAITLAIWRRRDAVQFLDFLAHEWNFIKPLLYDTNRRKLVVGRSLRLAFHQILAYIQRPHEVIDNLKNVWPLKHFETCCHILIKLLCEMRRPMPALNIYRTMQMRGIDVPPRVGLRLVAALTRVNSFPAANKLYDLLANGRSEPDRERLVVGLELYAQQGDHIRAKQFFDDLAAHGWDDQDVKTLYMYSHAVRGDMEKTLELFNDMYPVAEDGSRLNSPTRFTFSSLIHGFSRKGDLEQINEWLDLMFKAGYKADVYIYGAILNCFALRDDMTSITAVLSQMQAAGIRPNVVIYTTIMSLLARRGDVDGAEAIYMRAIREGIIPDCHMVTTLMNVHIEARSWGGVIRVFKLFEDAFADHTNGLGTTIYNNLLKAYVHIGAPYRLVLRLFNKFRAYGIEPDAYMYSTLINSACDSGLTNVATNIFRNIDALPRSNKLVTVYCLTIIMARFIQDRDVPKAKLVLDEMVQRGIEPSSISIATLLKSHGLGARKKTSESLVLAEEFIKSLTPKGAEWNKPWKDRKSALEHVYGPLLNAYCRANRPEDIERLYQDMLDAGGRPTLGILVLLLNSYRGAKKPEPVMHLWPQIVQLGLDYTESTKAIQGIPESVSLHSRLKDSILCTPLSIYIDAMSAAGYHDQVVKAWEEHKEKGFGFDSHNWNHLVMALIRAGKIDYAFEVVEKVILPNWDKWKSPRDILVREIERMEKLDNADADEPPDLSGDSRTTTGASHIELRRREKLKVLGTTPNLARSDPVIAAGLFDT
ncbi:hypothetical protein F5887DRAFT_217892 [Amanita rubescens]|nr:hypothetical protein F5887DRAFT_217892 [Amanita rubescens]